MRLARTELRLLSLAALCLLISSGANLLYPQIFRMVIDEGLSRSDREMAGRAGLMLVGVFAVQGVAVALRTLMFYIAGDRVVMRLREQLFRSLMTQDMAFFDERRTGDLTSRLSSDATALQGAVINIVGGLQNLAIVVGGISFLFYTSPRLTLVMLAVIPPVSIIGLWCGRWVRDLSWRVQDSLAQANGLAEESLSGVRTVQSFTAEEGVIERYRTAILDAFKLGYKRAVASAAFAGGISFIGYSSVVLVLWYGGSLILENRMTVGELGSFLVYTLMIAMGLGGLSELWSELMRAVGAAHQVFELVDRVPAIRSQGGKTLERVLGELQFQGVRFAYPRRPEATVLSGFNLTINAGEVVALVGPSGAGKSTVASLLSRLYDPQEGRILLDGVELQELDLRWLRQQIGMVAQEPLLFSCSIAENIRYGRAGASDEEVEEAARAANVHEFVSRLPKGYHTQVGERGAQLSGGQKQRVAIARALLKNPPLLILDEATSALDAESEYLVKEALERLMKQRTTLIIAHRLSTVANADRVVVLEGGRIVQSGKHSTLISEEGLYQRLVERQFVAA